MTTHEDYDDIAFMAGAVEDTHSLVTRGVFSYIHPGATVGARTVIFPHAYIGPRVVIGDDCVIGPGACIGQPGFGYREEEGQWKYREHMAGVHIASDVHIGANACIDQGRYRQTMIGFGTRIDNNVHIAHNVEIGRYVLVIANAMVAGSVEIDDGVIVNPGAQIRDHAKIGERAIIGMGAVVTKDVPPCQVWVGNPARFLRVRAEGESAVRRDD